MMNLYNNEMSNPLGNGIYVPGTGKTYPIYFPGVEKHNFPERYFPGKTNLPDEIGMPCIYNRKFPENMFQNTTHLPTSEWNKIMPQTYYV